MKKFLILITLLCLNNVVITSLVADETSSNEEPKLLFEGGNEAILATRNKFFIQYSDEVSGGCLPKPARLKDKLELSLRRNGLAMSSSDKSFDDMLMLNALGFKAGANYCAVSLTLTLQTWVAVRVPYAQGNKNGELTIVPMQFVIGQYLLTGRKGSMQKRLEKVSSELGDSLYLKIARSRDKIFEKFPIIEQNYKASNLKQK